MPAPIPTCNCTAAPAIPAGAACAEQAATVLAPVPIRLVSEDVKRGLVEPPAQPHDAPTASRLSDQNVEMSPPRVFMLYANDSSICPHEFCQSPGAIDNTPPLKASVLGNSMLTVYHCRLEGHVWAACDVHPVLLFDMVNSHSIDGLFGAGCPQCRKMELDALAHELAQRDKSRASNGHMEVLPMCAAAPKHGSCQRVDNDTYAQLAQQVKLSMKTSFDRDAPCAIDINVDHEEDAYHKKANMILNALAAREGLCAQPDAAHCYRQFVRARAGMRQAADDNAESDVETYYGSDSETQPPRPVSPACALAMRNAVAVARPISAPSTVPKHFIPLSRSTDPQ